ncbi:hypothetical protein [Halopelagius fulvigenes]|uniref:Uncharacterized protein n=1 Tax=Halopelagius fulvigenes TaxID=1198324 RepID=A0ABD5TVF5_9EURY
MAERDWSTIAVRPDTLARLKEVKPYESLSFDEFLTEVVEMYESTREADAPRGP